MSKSPLSVAQKESDNIKKEVEKLIKECNKSVKNTKLKDKEEKLKQLYLQCRQVKKRVSAHLKETENLDKKDEPKTVKNYENKKTFEVNRLGTFENQLNQVMPKLCPDDNEEEFIKKLSENGELSNEENGVYQEDGEEEDEEEDDDEKSKTKTKEEKKDSEESKPEEKDEKKLTKKELAKIKKEEEKKKKEEEKKRKEEEKKKKEEEKKKMKEEEKKNKSKGKDSKKEEEEEAKKEKTKVEDVEDGKKKKKKEDEEDEESEEEEDDDEEIEEDIEGDDEDESDEEEDDDEEDEHKDKKEMKKEQPVVTAKPRKSLLQREEKVEEIASEVEESEEEEEEEEDEEEEEEEEEESEDEDAVKEEIVKKEKIESRESAPVVSIDKHKKEEDDEEDDDDEEEEDDEEEDEDEEEEDEEEEEEEEEDDDKQEQSNADLEVTQPTARFEVIDDFAGETEEDLSVKKGEIIRIIDTREDGWWKAVNEEGKEGLVPKTFLQMYNQYKDVQQVDEEEEKEEEEEKLEGEEVTDGKIPKSQRSGKELWGSLRKQVNETLVSDVLHAMGAGPSGFRMPTLSKYYNESEKFRMKNFLAPKLSSSNLSYRDLFMNPGTGQMRATTVKLERIITLSSCQQIPPPAAGITVQRRYVRMCLFDGVNVLSNIHTIRVSSEDKTNRNWNFNARITDVMNVEQHNEFFVRGNVVDGNIGVLFELCISCVKSKSEERGEFSCGWVHLPLFDKAGIPIANKNYDCYVHGGTPYERDVEVDPSISRRASSNALVSLISGNKQPRLLLRVSTPSREQKSQLDLLPETLVGDMCLLSFYTYYRQILADTLIIHRLDLESTEPIHSPFLNLFPEVGDQPDLMSLFRENWILKCKSLKRAEKPSFFFHMSKLRDSEAMKKMFQAVFMETVYPVLNMNNFHPYKLGNTEVEQKRRNAIEKAAQVRRERRSALAVLLASDIVFKPFEMSEVTFNIISPHSLSEKIVPVPVEA